MNSDQIHAAAESSTRLPRRTAIARVAGSATAGLLASLALAGNGAWLVAAQSATPPQGAGSYIVIRRYQLLPDASIDELVQHVEEGFVPIISQIPGFVEYFLVDGGDGAHLSISVFQNPESAEESTRAAADWAAATVAGMLEGPPEVVTGWVRVHAEAAAPA